METSGIDRYDMNSKHVQWGFFLLWKCVFGIINWNFGLKLPSDAESHKLNNFFILFNCKKCTNMQQSEKYDKLICPKGGKMSSSFSFFQLALSLLFDGFATVPHCRTCSKPDGKIVKREIRTKKRNLLVTTEWIYEFVQPDSCNYTKSGQSFASL